MSEILLIEKSDFAGFRTISSKVDQAAQLDPVILEAQRLDLLRMLGKNLYFKLQEILKSYKTGVANAPEGTPYTPTEEEQKYLYLLNGRGYTNRDGYYREYLGVKPVLVYLTFARYVRAAHIQSTQTGFQRATNNYSDPVGQREINDMAVRAENDAQVFMGFVEEYMSDFAGDFKAITGGLSLDSLGVDPTRTKLGAVRGRTVIKRSK